MQNVGVLGRTDNNGMINVNYGAQQNFGVAGYAGGANLNIALYGEAATNVGSTNYAAYFVGTTVAGGSILIPSDSTLKENITSINDFTDSLFMLLEPKQFEFMQTGDAARLGLSDGTRFGVLAQQVEPLFPQLVRTVTHPAELDSVGGIINPSFQYKAIDMEQMIPLMLFDLKKKSEIAENLTLENLAQDSIINDLNERLTLLENCLSNLLPALSQANAMSVESTPEEMQETLRTVIDVELSDKNNIVLNQNVPNPFAERTVITYMIPETVVKAQIHFYDGMGKLINSVDVTERGNGQINVFASDLSTGVYTYSLIADGKIVTTKRMMKE